MNIKQKFEQVFADKMMYLTECWGLTYLQAKPLATKEASAITGYKG